MKTQVQEGDFLYVTSPITGKLVQVRVTTVRLKGYSVQELKGKKK